MQRAPSTSHTATATLRPRHRLGTALFAVVALLAALTSQPTRPAAATAGEEAQFVVALNQVRANVGLPALIVNNELVVLARQHSQVMADAGKIFHADPISAGFTGPWAKLGENVGIGASVQVLVDAFVASPGHYSNIIDPGFTHVGVGVVWKDSALYTTHRFLQLPSSPPPPTTSPPTTSQPVAPPPVTAPPGTQPAAPPPTTTTTLAPLPPPAILPERLIELINLTELVGT